ncbi:MAG: 5-formyltetrahydrofolate cyclo-ligase [Clostridiaceae bacterium]
MHNNLLKSKLREKIGNLRELLSEEEKVKQDEIIYKKLIESDFYMNSKVVFIYVSFGKEVDTLRIINKLLEDGKVVCVPKVINKKEGMRAIRINSLNQLIVGYFGVLEPTVEDEMIPENIDLCVLPGLAFDNQGGRLGYGGGFYDRFLCKVSEDTKLIAVAYTFQILDNVPMESYDFRIQGIITP